MPKFSLADGDRGQFMDYEQVILSNLCEKVTIEHPVIAEIGSWLGQSTAVLGDFAKKQSGTVCAIDWFKGSGEKTPLQSISEKFNIREIFDANMKELGLSECIKVIQAKSLDAVQQFADSTFDMIFIDGDHRYSQVSKDIAEWYPKLKTGGLFCGHDCERYAKDVTPELREHKEEDYWNGIHCGVVVAVSEFFGHKYQIEGRIWWVLK